MAFLLSILIPSIPERADALGLLETECARQANGLPVEIVANVTPRRTNGGPNIPTKRNQLYSMAKGIYSVQIDDDDMILDGYVEKVLAAMESGPDVITYDIRVVEHDKSITRARVSIEYSTWQHLPFPDMHGYKYYQAPYFKVPIRTVLCQSVGVNEAFNWAEDADFMKRMRPRLQTGEYINEELYLYNAPPAGQNPKIRY